MVNTNVSFYDQSDKGEELFFSDAPRRKNLEEKSRFFRVKDDPKSLIKYSVTGLNVDKTVDMLNRFSLVKDRVFRTKLPSGLYFEDGKVSGTVIPYYENSPSLYNIAEHGDLYTLMEYYHHDEDVVHNFYMMLSDVLDSIEELKEHGLGYMDCNPGNVILDNNKVRLIDFDPNYMEYEMGKKTDFELLKCYDTLVFVANKRFQLCDLPTYKPKDFKAMRKRLVKIENKVQKRLR